MKKRLMNTTLLALLALSTAACPRRVEVESEPNPEYSTQISTLTAAPESAAHDS